MMTLKAAFKTGSELLERYLGDLANGGLFIPTRRPLAIGEAVVVSVRPGPRQNPISLRGTVAWRRAGKHRTKVKAGIAIEFLSTESAKRDYLLAAAEGRVTAISARRHQRVPIDLPVQWQVSGSIHENNGVLRDIGRGGAFVMTDDPAPGESDVVLKVSAPGADVPMPVSARVAWIAAHQSREPGFGVAWRARDAGGSRRIKELVRRIERLAGESVTI